MKETKKKELIVEYHEWLSEQNETHSEEQVNKFLKAQAYPRTWEDFCETTPIDCEYYFTDKINMFRPPVIRKERRADEDRNLLPDRETAEAVLALCQLIQLRNCYNRGWVPDWEDKSQRKWVIQLYDGIVYPDTVYLHHTLLAFKSEEIRDKFQHNFFELIKALKPLYGIKRGGNE